jgi:uncharacterized protein (TIGR00106 family)
MKNIGAVMLASFSIIPLDKGESLSRYVSEIIDLIDKSGLDYRLGAMSTTVEGDMNLIFELIKQCHLKMRKRSRRVVTNISIDDREGATKRLNGKPQAIETILKKKLKR